VLVGAGATATPSGEAPGVVPGDAETAAATEAGESVAVTQPQAEPTATEQPPSPTPQPPPTETPPPPPTATPEATATPEPPPTEPSGGSGQPTLVNAALPEWQEGKSESFGRDDFVAGGAYRREDGVLYDRPAAHLYSQATDFPSTTVKFDVDERPTDHVGLTIVGMDDENPNAVPCRIMLNDKIIWDGPSPFGNEEWTLVGWQINALGWLKEGENSLTIEMTVEDGEFGLPPWLLLTEATVYWD
jgi:hypothetical protein